MNKKEATTTPYPVTCSPCHCLLNLKVNQCSVQNLHPEGSFLDSLTFFFAFEVSLEYFLRIKCNHILIGSEYSQRCQVLSGRLFKMFMELAQDKLNSPSNAAGTMLTVCSHSALSDTCARGYVIVMLHSHQQTFFSASFMS